LFSLFTIAFAVAFSAGCAVGESSREKIFTWTDDYHSGVGLDRDIRAYRASATAAAYYIDSVTGDDANDGRSPEHAWKNVDRLHAVRLGPGDVVRLARGSMWEQQCLLFDNGSAGTEARPIIIESYGTGALPLIRDPRALWDKSRFWPAVSFGRDSKVATPSSWIRLLELNVTDALGPAISMSGETRNILVAGCEVSKSAMGVSIAGEWQRVIGCYVHDGIMGVDIGDPDKDWGANGVGVTGKHNEIAWNAFARCVAPSKSFGTDGGAVEFFGHDSDTGHGWDYVCEDIAVHHNVTADSDCFMEALGKVKGLTIAFNTYTGENHGAIMLHLNTIRTDTYYEALIANNTFYCANTDKQGWGIIGLLVNWDNLSSPNLAQTSVIARNNIFVTDYTVLSWVNPIGSKLVHDHNLIHLVGKGRLSDNAGVWTEAGDAQGDPLFANATARDFTLTADSPAIRKGVIIATTPGTVGERAFAQDLAGKNLDPSTTPDCGVFAY